MFGLGWTLIKGSSVPGPLRCPKTMALTKYVTFGKQGGLLAGILMGIRMAQHEIKRGIEQKIMKNALKL